MDDENAVLRYVATIVPNGLGIRQDLKMNEIKKYYIGAILCLYNSREEA